MSTLLRYLQTLAGREACRTSSDRELLERFTQQRDEFAFAALVERHGPLVLAACRRILDREADIEDVVQATFLVLVRKAAEIRQPGSVGPWLYGVAVRLARKLRVQQQRQRQLEQTLAQTAPTARTQAMDDLTVHEARRLLDEELAALPAKYRDPLILCGLEGKTRDEAAAELGWEPGAVKIRLERGRELLRERLRRRGVALSSALFLTLLDQTTTNAATLPLKLASSLLELAAQPVTASAAVVALAASGVTTPLPWLALIGAGLVLVGISLSAWAHTAKPPETDRPQVVEPAPDPLPELPPVPMPFPPLPVEVVEGPPFVAQFVAIEEQTIVLRRREADTRYLLVPGSRLLLDGQPARFSDLRNRARVRAVPSADGETILRLEILPTTKE